MSKSFEQNQDAERIVHALIVRARDGDDEACGELIERWRDYLLMIANEDLDPKIQARIAPSDVVQLSMLEAQQNLKHFRGETAVEFQTWVRRILKNKVVDARRGQLSKKRGGAHPHVDVFDSTAPPPLSDSEATPQTSALLDEQSKLVQTALASLPTEQRDVIRRKTWQDQSFAAIARDLALDENEVRRLWYRAIVQLQKTIRKQFPEFTNEA